MRNEKTINYLLKKGMKPNYDGFWYLHDAVQIVIDNNNILPMLIKEVYPTIANNYGTKWQNIERGIRYIRQSCKDLKLKYMTNSEFISYIALEISMMK